MRDACALGDGWGVCCGLEQAMLLGRPGHQLLWRKEPRSVGTVKPAKEREGERVVGRPLGMTRCSNKFGLLQISD